MIGVSMNASPGDDGLGVPGIIFGSIGLFGLAGSYYGFAVGPYVTVPGGQNHGA